jgi:murein DD-endopeptidase MepM/ murein hydrolase activator NlpD
MKSPSPVALRVAASAVVGLLALGALAAAPRGEPLPQPPIAVARAAEAPAARYRTATHVVAEGDTAGGVLRALGGDAGNELLAAAGRRLDRLSIGDRIHVDWRDADARPWRLRLEHGSAVVATIERAGERWIGWDRPIPYTITDGVTRVVVKQGSSLWGAANAAGLDEGQIGALARIYEYDVDFNTEIRPGAVIRAVAEKLVGDDGSVRYGDIRAAELTNGGKPYTAIRYQMKDGSIGWFAPDGTGRRRPFLRSPLAFSRVTSGFNLKRFHPVLKRARPHLGTDFGAPTGTPVRAVADGLVEIAGRHGGHGNFVQLDHEGPYATSYSHLSAVLVKRGQKVKQGDLIGRVGSTGMSTGPHLHYQFLVNGKHTNPMTVELPMTGSLPDAERDAFFAMRDQLLPLLVADADAEEKDAAQVADAPTPDAAAASEPGAGFDEAGEPGGDPLATEEDAGR